MRGSVTGGTSTLATVRKQFMALPSYCPNAAPETTLAANTSKAEPFVDYSSVYYANVRRPFIGSASATVKLNENGTLAENTAEIEDKTVETLAEALPIGEALVGDLTAGSAEDTVHLRTSDERKPAPVQLVVTPLRFKHVLSKTQPLVNNQVVCSPGAPIELSEKDKGAVNYRREAVTGDSDKSDKDENAIDVSGKIVLPKKSGGK